jgi:nucleoside phosphorylase
VAEAVKYLTQSTPVVAQTNQKIFYRSTHSAVICNNLLSSQIAPDYFSDVWPWVNYADFPGIRNRFYQYFPDQLMQTTHAQMRPQSRNDFRIAIICALAREFDAVEDSFDERYNFTDFGKQRGDANFYCTGRLGKHNIVLVCLPEIGKRNAASIASTLRVSFANIELALLVGICGGVPFPSPDTEVILGDVIIGIKVIEYDFGKQYPGGFQLKGNFMETIGRADRDIRSIISVLNTKRIKDEFQERHLCHLVNLQKLRNTWQYPGIKEDRLFKTKYLHKHHGHSPEMRHGCTLCQSNQDSICEQALKSDCDTLGCTGEVQRDRLKESDPRPRIHLGSFASGDTVMKSAEHRDILVEKTEISGFEMEGAAICDSLRCVIIKGVSDYSDSHKNNIWQNYAAATAASCAKAFLEILPATIPEGVYISSLKLCAYLY